jgi:DNA-directed RNA polymerase specialized sigma24 family protein
MKEATDGTAEIEDVYRRAGAKLWRSVLAYSADPDLASDAVAEAFAQALARGDAVRDVERWVWRAGFKIAAGELHRKRHSRGRTLLERTYEIGVPASGSRSRTLPCVRRSTRLRRGVGHPSRSVHWGVVPIPVPNPHPNLDEELRWLSAATILP